jgi:hypothetical protein
MRHNEVKTANTSEPDKNKDKKKEKKTQRRKQEHGLMAQTECKTNKQNKTKQFENKSKPCDQTFHLRNERFTSLGHPLPDLVEPEFIGKLTSGLSTELILELAE